MQDLSNSYMCEHKWHEDKCGQTTMWAYFNLFIFDKCVWVGGGGGGPSGAFLSGVFYYRKPTDLGGITAWDIPPVSIVYKTNWDVSFKKIYFQKAHKSKKIEDWRTLVLHIVSDQRFPKCPYPYQYIDAIVLWHKITGELFIKCLYVMNIDRRSSYLLKFHWKQTISHSTNEAEEYTKLTKTTLVKLG